MSPTNEEPPEQQPAADPAPDPDWEDHPAREVLRLAFWSGEIPLDWNRKPQMIYDKFKDHAAFKGMPYDSKFKSRLRSLRDQVKDKIARKAVDQEACDVFLKNYPAKEFNSVGVRRWHGTKAEEYFKADMLEGKNVGVKPQDFWKSRPEYQEFPLETFRKHIGQERKLWKLENFLEDKAIKDKAKAQKRAKKKANRLAAVMKKAMALAEAEEDQAKKRATKKKSRGGKEMETESDPDLSHEQLEAENEEVESDSHSSSSSSSSSSFERFF